ncbi:MAG TPA: hypothetical protein H9844_03220 [Candidatus Evtepia faecigallinarum]|nr:hypothetical protein [Candidatus Evtepia faecigallinarum]
MILSPMGAGAALYFSREELPSGLPLTQQAALPLIRQAMARARRPVPAALEIRSFPSRQGVLFLVRPRLPAGEEGAPGPGALLS